MTPEVTLKPMLAECVREALVLALIDSCWPTSAEGVDRDESWTPEERQELRHDIHKLPGTALARMDLEALAQNLAVRLLGRGGWELPAPRGAGSIYTGNATTREVFDATFDRPDRDQVAELGFDLGLGS